MLMGVTVVWLLLLEEEEVPRLTTVLKLKAIKAKAFTNQTHTAAAVNVKTANGGPNHHQSVTCGRWPV